MTTAIIKFIRFEGSKVIIIPSADGVKYFNENKPKIVASERPTGIEFSQAEEKIAGQDIIAYVADLGSPIANFSYEMCIPLNYTKGRFFLASTGINFYLNIPYQVRDSQV